MLTQIVETADLVSLNEEPYLVVPVDDRMIDVLAAYLSDIEDNEQEHEDDIEQDGDIDEDKEPDDDASCLDWEYGDGPQIGYALGGRKA